MVRRQIQRLQGMRDVTGSTYERIRQLADTFTSYLTERGYGLIETPLLEETELFVRKSGGEFTGRLYTFTDPGGRQISLRPEFTSSVIRHFIQEQDSLNTPVRWQYRGPVFRYEPDHDGGRRQFNQVGAEVVGAAGVEVDAEILSTALGGLQQFGARGCQLRVGHLGVLGDVLSSYGLSEPAKLFIVGQVQGMKSGSTDVATIRGRAQDVGLLRPEGMSRVGASLAGMNSEAARELIQGVLNEAIQTPVGRRTTEEIVQGLMRKVHHTDDPHTFEAAASVVSELARLDGTPGDVLDSARRIACDQGIQTGSFDELERLFELLAGSQTDEGQLILDLGLARGISYYTGVIFELMYSFQAPGVSLGGGGRYDGLVRSLGGREDVPALGFAFNLDQIADELEHLDSSTLPTPVEP